ncbi:GH32 C-terminal domain-containing protein [Aggregatibacter actinomycetemcomitans]|nr:GH32 C-terminal domain-containing protein [Aggregatibacter actinomycetemcomitans]MBN6071420.1 GH32 C-terminal domain-containing protein [Aggregatibacter actinomycetemcomitans]
MPRKLHLAGTKIYQRPIAKTYENLTALSALSLENQLENQAEIAHLDRAYVKFNANNQAFKLDFFQNAKGQKLTLSYDNGVLCLDRSATEQTELMEKFDAKRFCDIENLQNVEIFFDRSVVEIFLNDGEKVMTSRFFIADRKNQLRSEKKIDLQIGYPAEIQYG